MRISYSWKQYPYMDKLTRKSKTLGYWTGAPGKILFGLVYLLVLANVFESLGLKHDILVFAVLISAFIVPNIVLNKVREVQYRKLDQRFLEEIQQLQYSDPVKYHQIMLQMSRR